MVDRQLRQHPQEGDRGIVDTPGPAQTRRCRQLLDCGRNHTVMGPERAGVDRTQLRSQMASGRGRPVTYRSRIDENKSPILWNWIDDFGAIRGNEP